MSLGRIATGQDRELRLNLASDLGRATGARLFHQSRRHSFLKATPTDIGDGGTTTQQGLSHFGISTSLAATAVGQQQDAGTGLHARWGVAILDEGFELGALLRVEVKWNVCAHTFSLPDSRLNAKL